LGCRDSCRHGGLDFFPGQHDLVLS
jgi:hypothetical protein